MKYTDLVKMFESYQKEIEGACEAFPWEDPKAYAHWLANSYHYAYNSTRILALAAGCMPKDKTSISNRFVTHAAEEKGHEKLLENDLKNLGEDLKAIPVTNEMKLYYRSLYYWLSPAGSPLGILGWVLSLEGVAANFGPKIYERTLKAHGAKATTFVRVHADADPDHLNKAFKTVEPFNSDEISIVFEAMQIYSKQYCSILSAIGAQSPREFKKAA